MEKSMNDEKQILENVFSHDRNRQAIISRDKYHYIVELRENDKQSKTVLFNIVEHPRLGSNPTHEQARRFALQFVEQKTFLVE